MRFGGPMAVGSTGFIRVEVRGTALKADWSLIEYAERFVARREFL